MDPDSNASDAAISSAMRLARSRWLRRPSVEVRVAALQGGDHARAKGSRERRQAAENRGDEAHDRGGNGDRWLHGEARIAARARIRPSCRWITGASDESSQPRHGQSQTRSPRRRAPAPRRSASSRWRRRSPQRRPDRDLLLAAGRAQQQEAARRLRSRPAARAPPPPATLRRIGPQPRDVEVVRGRRSALSSPGEDAFAPPRTSAVMRAAACSRRHAFAQSDHVGIRRRAQRRENVGVRVDVPEVSPAGRR